VLNPEKFLVLATVLLRDAEYDEEARYRTCISRAYYATHLFTREKLKKIGVVIVVGKDERKGAIHEKVIEALKGKNAQLGKMLSDLRERRGDADYDLDMKFSGFSYGIGIDISNAKFIINEVNKLKK